MVWRVQRGGRGKLLTLTDLVREFPGPLSADLHRFHGARLVDIGRSVSLWDAARWVTWLPPDAVTYLAIQSAADDAQKTVPGKGDVAEALAAMRSRRESELAAMGGE